MPQAAMSREHDFPGPPTPGRASFFSRLRDGHLPPRLATVDHGLSGQLNNSPSSTLSAAFSPSYASPTSSQGQAPRRNPIARSYDPRQWLPSSGANSSSTTPFSIHSTDVSGMEATLPSPPPPYRSPQPESMSRVRRTTQLRIDLSPVTSPPHAAETPSLPVSTRASPYIGQSSGFGQGLQSTGLSSAYISSSARSHESHSALLGGSTRIALPRQEGRDHDRSSQSPQHQSLEFSSVPPAARRAHSMGAVGVASQSSMQLNHHYTISSWQQGQPLPPPPPGPPPSMRSQSLHRPACISNNSSEQRQTSLTSPTMFRASSLVSPLSPIPPTPTNWEDDSNVSTSQSSRHERTKVPETGLFEQRKEPLARQPARREQSADGIRERRSRSKAIRESGTTTPTLGQDQYSSINAIRPAIGPADLVIMPPNASTKSSSSQKPPKLTSVLPSEQRTDVPPKGLSILTPPYTPAELQRPDIHSASSNRTHDVDKGKLKQTPSEQDDVFHASLDRYLQFSQQESAARSDSERLRVFAEYIVEESRLRRERYAESFDSTAIDLYDITRDLWRPLQNTPTKPAQHLYSRDVSLSSAGHSMEDCSEASVITSSEASFIDMTPATDDSSCDGSDCGEQDDKEYNARLNKFQPTLSPIPSMAMSTVPDETSSRGRSASRWWEASEEGSTGAGTGKLDRPRTELKYMSLHPSELQAAAQRSPATSTPTPGASGFTLESDIYPPEKVGYHDAHEYDHYERGPMLGNSQVLVTPLEISTGPALDISRLVTLPPPYPRHYPAVNNCHPVLEESRQTQRDLANLDYLRSLKQSFEAEESERRAGLETIEAERKRVFVKKLQSDLNNDAISPTTAWSTQERFDRDQARRAMYSDYETQQRFDTTVKDPGGSFLHSKIAEANSSINTILLVLSREEHSGHSERTQVSGDEEPELLEQLTLLKWLFEAREQLHKEVFDLCQRSMQICNAPDHGTLDTDLRDAFARSSTSRLIDLQTTFSTHVSCGVEAQISAFWDIAPQLLDLIQNIPSSHSALETFSVAIPPSELVENPSYETFPQQYLYTMLSHAQKSSYQFIEAQINLLCLLHEVQVATSAAETRLQELEMGQGMHDEGREEIKRLMERRRQEREEELTTELKDRVGEVEMGWDEALGHAIKKAMLATSGFLKHVGGWEEGLEELG